MFSNKITHFFSTVAFYICQTTMHYIKSWYYWQVFIVGLETKYKINECTQISNLFFAWIHLKQFKKERKANTTKHTFWVIHMKEDVEV